MVLEKRSVSVVFSRETLSGASSRPVSPLNMEAALGTAIGKASRHDAVSATKREV